MKEKLVSHIVNATTKHRKAVILIAILLCILSISAMVLFLGVDFSFKGIAGKGIKEVDDFDKLIRDFKVSGVTTITLQPLKETETQVKDFYRQINDLVYDALNQGSLDNDKGKESVISIFKEYYEAKSLRTLSNKETILITIEMLELFGTEKRKEILYSVKGLSEEDKNLILSNINNEDKEKQKSIYRKLQKLEKPDMTLLISKVDELTQEQKNKIVKFILNYISIYDKKSLVENLKIINDFDKENLISKIDEIDKETGLILGEFKKTCVKFSGELKKMVLSDLPAKGSFSNEKLNEVVRGVLYSDEISLSKDQLMYMIMVSPQKDVGDMINLQTFAVGVDEVLNKLKEKYKNNLIAKRTGLAVMQQDENEAVLDGFGVMMVITVVGILLIFLIGLRRLIYPVLSMIALVIAIIVMFGLFALIGELNLFAMMTPVLLFGLGIDYAIYFGTRYGEVRGELGQSASQEEVLKQTFDSIGIGLLIAALTTVFAFLSLIISIISGFTQFGLMAASGVITSFLSMIYILPVLITWRERKFKKTGISFLNTKKFIGLGRFANSVWAIVIAIIIFLIALSSILLIPKIEMETDFMKLEPEGLESVELSRELEDKFDTSDTQSFFVVKGDDKLKGYDKLKKFRKELNRKESDGSNVYPTINTLLVMDARRAIRTFEKLGWEVGDLNTLTKYKEKYAKKVNMMGSTNETIAELYEFIIRNYVNWEKDEYLVVVPPSGYAWDTDFIELHMQDIEKLEKISKVNGAGFIKVWNFLMKNMLNDLILASIIAFSLIILIIFSTTKSIKGTIICCFSLLISIVSTVSIISLIGIKFNVFNIIAFPLIMGLGIDYSVHIYYRIVHEEKGNIINAVSSTGKAVLLTTLTTLMAFGSMSFSTHPGLAQFGQFICVGLILAFLSSLFIIPNLIKLFYGNKINNKLNQ